MVDNNPAIPAVPDEHSHVKKKVFEEHSRILKELRKQAES